MKRLFLIYISITCWLLTTQAQQITHRFVNVTMPEALSWLDKKSNDFTINFIYDELEDFKVTTDIKQKSLPDAIQSLIGFYPIKASVTTIQGDGVTMPKDYHHTYISVECTQKMTYHYKGIVYDNHNQPLPYANIILLNAQDSTYLNGGVSNESGVFVVPCDAKKVIARISYVGFKTLHKTCTDGKVGNIILLPTSKNLNAVVIKGEKPMVAYHGDRLIADIKNSPLSKGFTGESLLQQLPGVWSQNGNVSINGQSGTKIYIGDRQVHLTSQDLSTYLKGIRSEDIDKVEIIAHPSAEYDAQGQGGIIRILLKSKDQGAELNIGSTFGLAQYYEISPKTQFAYHQGKWSIDVSVNGTAWSKGRDNSDNHVVLKDKDITYDTFNHGMSHAKGVNLNASIDYAFNAQNELLLNGILALRKSTNKNEASTHIQKATQEIITQTDMLMDENSHNKQFMLSANYTHKFDEEGNRNVKVMADVARQYSYSNQQDYHYTNFDKDGKEISQEFLGQNIPSQFLIYSFESRYTHNTKNSGQWIVGAKGSYTKIENGLGYHDESGNPINDKGYDYGLQEVLYAVYAKYQINRKTWDLTLGLRGEADIPHYLESQSRETPASSDVKFDAKGTYDLFPSIYYTKRFSDYHSLSLSYSRRTQRVSYRNLLPERYHDSKYEITEGNPNIRPDYPNELSLTYTLRGKYMLGAEYTWSNNGFNAQIKSIIEDGVPTYVSTFTDGMRSRQLYFYLYAPIMVCKWWKMNFRPWGRYGREKTDDIQAKSFCYGIVSNQMFTLPHDFRFTLLYIAKSTIKNGNYEELANNNLYATLSKSFCHDHWTLSLNAYNLFYKNNLKMRYTMKDVLQTRKFTTTSPSLYLDLNYNIQWGKQKNRMVLQHSNDEERGRL